MGTIINPYKRMYNNQQVGKERNIKSYRIYDNKVTLPEFTNKPVSIHTH